MTEQIETLLAYEPKNLAWPVPTPGQIDWMGRKESLWYLKQRKKDIEAASHDPLRFGYRPRMWDVVEQNIADLRSKFPSGVVKLILFGGNRSGKSKFATNYVLRQCHDHPGYRVWCCDSTEAMSRSNQMRLLHEQFPVEWRDLERDEITDIRYSVSDGFSKNKIVFPNKSESDFKFYSMDLSNLPGPELDLIYCDELVPLDWVETLVYRLVNRNGLLLITFTPELGWSETFASFYEGAEILEEADAPLLPKFDKNGDAIGYKKVPRVMQCSDPTARIVFFHTSDNPFSNYPALVQQLKNKSEDEILIRAYGVATKSQNVAFPRFNHSAHIITEAQFAALQKEYPKGQRYHFVDPCSGRNWAQIWIFCPCEDAFVIYREWPSHGHREAYIEGVGMVGPWALSGAAADGVIGPAQKTFGFGLERYVEEILSKEKGEQILARYVDSRYANAATLSRERATTLIEQLTEAGMDFYGMVPESRILGVADGSIDLINSALYYDAGIELGKFSADLGRINMPKLRVVESCPNTIWALEHWSGADGQRGACKDFVDCIRGAFLSSINYMDENAYCFVGGGLPR